MRQKLLILFLFCLLIPQTWGQNQFIRVRGIHFTLNGSPFYANGFNAHWLMYMASDPSQRPKIAAAFRQAASHGLTVARTWAFSDGGGYRPLQHSPGFYNEQVFRGLDYVIAEAARHGIRLIMSLANNHENFGGKRQYVNWARNQGLHLTSDDDFFTNPVVRGFFRNHIRVVLNRRNTITGVPYRNDPTIMAWELMNDPRSNSDPSGRIIQTWIREMASHVKSIDSNHLLEAGLEGSYGHSTAWRTHLNPAGLTTGTDFIANNLIPGIDFATVHSYPDQWLLRSNNGERLTSLRNWLDAHIHDAEHILQKPLLITAFGKSVREPGFSSYQRDIIFNIVYVNVYTSAQRGGPAAGALFWQLVPPGMNSLRDGYEVVIDENPSTASLIARQAHRLYQIRMMLMTRRGNFQRRRWSHTRRFNSNQDNHRDAQPNLDLKQRQ